MVYEKGNFLDRADLLIYDRQLQSYYLIEAKRFTNGDAIHLTDWIIKHSEAKLKEVIEKQAAVYYESEKHFFENKKTYLGVIYFEEIKNAADLEKLSPSRINTGLKDTFYSFSYDTNNTNIGIAVYGLIIEPNKI